MRNERERERKTMKPELDKELEIWIYENSQIRLNLTFEKICG